MDATTAAFVHARLATLSPGAPGLIDDGAVRAPRGPERTAKSWLTEAPPRMLMNNLDPEVAGNPHALVVYGGIGRAARDWDSCDRIVAALRALDADETLLVQSGKPVGVFRTHEDAPRLLIANSNLVPHWATWDHFNELDRKDLAMCGQMTAGSWIYIGGQGIVQGTYETFVEMGRQHDGGDLSGRWVLTAGMGGAQTLAATVAGASCLGIACRPAIEFRLRTGYVDAQARDLDDALARMAEARRAKVPVSVALLGNAADLLPEIVRRGVRPDILTDQTSAHDPVNGCLLAGWTLEEWERERAPKETAAAARASVARHVQAMLDLYRAGVPTVDYGNNIRQVALEQGVADAFAFPGFVPAYIRPLFCRGVGPFRWVALSGDPEDIHSTDARVKQLLPDDAHLHHWLDMARARIRFQGLPARICWVGLGDRHRLGLAFNDMVASGELRAPVVIGRDHLDSGSVASPDCETEAMKDGSDAVSDWPLLNALPSTVSGATWVSLHHGGGVGMGFSQHAGMVIVADGAEAAGPPPRARPVERPGHRRHALVTPTPATTTPSPWPGRSSSTCRAFCDAPGAHPGGVAGRTHPSCLSPAFSHQPSLALTKGNPMPDAYICDFVRTPIGRYAGALKDVRADDLAAHPIRVLKERNPSVDWAALDDCYMGCANQAGEDNRNVARMATLLAGLPVDVPGATLNRLCGSGLDAVGTAARALRAGEAELMLAGGVESMTRAPFVQAKATEAFARAAEIHDTTIGWRFVNGLMKTMYGTDSMPETGENVAEQFQVTRQAQDAFALRSQQKAKAAQENGFFAREIAPVTIKSRRGDATVDRDEHPRGDTTMDSLAKLKTPFRTPGTVTAGNASGVNDGAAALLLATEQAARRHGLTPRARVVAMATVGVEPRIMGIGPAPAVRKLLARAGLSLADIDVIELNEAFASQGLAVLRQLGLADDDPRVNPHGGAIALGHPLGASGARLALTAVNALEASGGKRAIATMCIGVGQGIAALIERV